MIAIVDHGVGNFASVRRALERAGGRDVRLTASSDDLLAAQAIVLPGVGHFGHCARALRGAGLDQAVRTAAARGTPILGLCVGMQLLFAGSEEEPGTPGLGLLPGTVRRLPPTLRVPHMGWSTVAAVAAHPYAAGLRDGSHYYFAHSFSPDPASAALILATADPGVRIAAAVGAPGIVGVQFHPEKSGAAGSRFLAGFLQSAVTVRASR